MLKIEPFNAPYFLSASIVYSEQVGLYRQLPRPKYGETAA